MEATSVEAFASENNGTARFLGVDLDDDPEDNSGPGGNGVGGGGGCVSATHEFQTIKPGAGLKLEPSGRTEIPHSELMKMLCYLEGELQAREVVIAALRNERVKQYITQLRTKRVQPSDPYAAIYRDKIVLSGNLVSRESSMQAVQAEMEVRQIIEQQMEQQYQMVNKQRATHMRMVNILTESLQNNQRMLQELEEEKRKHEHDTAQGDDITYGLERERTRLSQELEEERNQVKKIEKEMKKLQETLEFERNRQKQIVLLLIAERKKILMKYIEEGKRSEDLAQILAEEKQRSDTIAEGLEEESKKSLRMEEELEKQAALFENERKSLKASLVKEELRAKELEKEIALLRAENEALKKQQQQQQSVNVSAAKMANLNDADNTAATPVVNIAKIVQPTATVSSVPVSGPTTGIARSLAPGQNLRCTAAAPLIAMSSASPVVINETTIAPSIGQNPPSPLVTTASPQTKMQPTATIQRAPGGGKYAALAAAAAVSGTHSLDMPAPHPVPIAVPPVTVPPAGARGAPPPIPPNKPVVLPKREPSLSRLASLSSAQTANIANASVAAGAASSTLPVSNANTNTKLN